MASQAAEFGCQVTLEFRKRCWLLSSKIQKWIVGFMTSSNDDVSIADFDKERAANKVWRQQVEKFVIDLTGLYLGDKFVQKKKFFTKTRWWRINFSVTSSHIAVENTRLTSKNKKYKEASRWRHQVMMTLSEAARSPMISETTKKN